MCIRDSCIALIFINPAHQLLLESAEIEQPGQLVGRYLIRQFIALVLQDQVEAANFAALAFGQGIGIGIGNGRAEEGGEQFEKYEVSLCRLYTSRCV